MSFMDIAKSTPISLIQQVSLKYPDTILFKLPTATNGVWEDITYAQFFTDVERVAYHTLCQRPYPEGSVIGIWTSGLWYSDAVHIFAIMRAGCVPHLINVELSRTMNDVVLDLLNESGASAIFLDSSLLGNDLSKFKPNEMYVIKDIKEYPTQIDRGLLPPVSNETSLERSVLVLQTSGSTEGRCKLVRWNSRIFSAAVTKRRHVLGIHRGNTSRPLTASRIGSFCHVAQVVEFFVVISFHGTIILLNPNFDSLKLLQMYRECGLTAFTQFPAFVALHLRNSRTDAFLLKVLQSMDEILFMGSALPEAELEWADENKIPLANGYGLTECGGLLVGWKEDPRHLVTLGFDGFHYDFRLITHTEGDVEISLDRDSKIQNLKELIVLSNSLDCPHPSLRSKTDGHFHTGDLFEEVLQGRYVYRGRTNDFVKMENGKICDTKSIEDHVRKHCGDLIHACVVVGTDRPSPALIVEPRLPDDDHEKLITSIELHLTTYNARVYQHERITRDHILLMARESLPRTLKGNIRRKIVEESLSQQLDQLYGAIQTK